jgi:thiamine pyrophosphate-dependent acetolactate synthase large subunit-like protein
VQGNLVRDYVKWDDQPSDLASVPESFARAYQIAMTEPTGPVYICFDAEIQENEYQTFPSLPSRDKLKPPAPPTAPPETIERVARALLEANDPVIVVDRTGRSTAAYEALLKLADSLAIPVLDQGMRHNFPTHHPMALSELSNEVLAASDYILALDVMDLFGATHSVDRLTRQTKPSFNPHIPIAHVTLDNYLVRSWSHDFRQLQETDDLIAADTSLFIPRLLDQCLALLKTSANRQAAQKVKAREQKWKGRIVGLQDKWLAQAEQQRGETPIALATLALCVWNVIKDEPWVLANGNLNRWVKRLWNIARPDQYMGKPQGGGLGYGIGAAIGVALAYPERLCVNLQADGDLLFTATGLWTAAHHKIPLLNIVVNNRSYYNSEEHAHKIAAHRGRPVENAPIGTRIEDPTVDFAQLAKSMGVYAEGPILRSDDIEPALLRALHIIKTEKRPALVDVFTQNR